MNTQSVTELVIAERQRQITKWGKQDHPLYVWILIIQEEIGEVAKAVLENDPMQLIINEAVQTAAVAVQIMEWVSEKAGFPTTPEAVLHKLLSSLKITADEPYKSHMKLTRYLGQIANNVAAGHDWKQFQATNDLNFLILYSCELVYNLQHHEQI